MKWCLDDFQEPLGFHGHGSWSRCEATLNIGSHFVTNRCMWPSIEICALLYACGTHATLATPIPNLKLGGVCSAYFIFSITY